MAMTIGQVPPPISARSMYGFAMGPLKRHFWMLLAVGIVAYFLMFLGSVFLGMLTGIAGIVSGADEGTSNAITTTFSLIFSVLVGIPMMYGVLFCTYLRAMRGEAPVFKDIFRMFKFNYRATVLSSIVVLVVVVIGGILLVFPGIYLGIRLSLVSYLVVDQGLGAGAALRESWRLTSGRVWFILKMRVLAIPIIIIGILLLFIGAVPAFIWIYLTHASVYESIRLADAPVTVSKSTFSE